MADETYVLRYLVDGYRLADAFRPNPKWGSTTYTVKASGLPPHDDADVVKSAQEAAPPGHWLQRVTAIGSGERELFCKPVPGAASSIPSQDTPT
jgi:hypothetical protein